MLLVRKRVDGPVFPGMWIAPGGMLELSDVARPFDIKNLWYNVMERVARRELYEETNLRLSHLWFLCSLVVVYSEETDMLVLCFCGLVNNPDDVMIQQSELDDYRWVNALEARNLDVVGGTLEEVDAVEKLLVGSISPYSWYPRAGIVLPAMVNKKGSL